MSTPLNWSIRENLGNMSILRSKPKLPADRTSWVFSFPEDSCEWTFGCLEILKRSSQPKLKLRAAITLEFFCTCKNSSVTKINCFCCTGCCMWRWCSSSHVCKGLTERQLHNPAQSVPQSQQSLFEHVHKADTEKQIKPPKGSLLRGTEARRLLFFLRN